MYIIGDLLPQGYRVDVEDGLREGGLGDPRPPEPLPQLQVANIGRTEGRSQPSHYWVQ